MPTWALAALTLLALIGAAWLFVGDRSGGHFQPMTAFCEPDVGEIWFFTRDDTDLARDSAGGAEAMFIIQAKDQAFQACLGGGLIPIGRPDRPGRKAGHRDSQSCGKQQGRQPLFHAIPFQSRAFLTEPERQGKPRRLAVTLRK